MSLEDDILRIYCDHFEEQDPRWKWVPITSEEDRAPVPAETEAPATPASPATPLAPVLRRAA